MRTKSLAIGVAAGLAALVSGAVINCRDNNVYASSNPQEMQGCTFWTEGDRYYELCINQTSHINYTNSNGRLVILYADADGESFKVHTVCVDSALSGDCTNLDVNSPISANFFQKAQEKWNELYNSGNTRQTYNDFVRRQRAHADSRCLEFEAEL